VGTLAAAAMIANRANDGSTPPQTFLPASVDPGVWQPTPPLFGPGILLHWRDLTPFGIASSDQFRSGPPPALTSGQYTKAYREVLSVGDVNSATRPQDRTDVANFFAVANAVYVWNVAVQQVSAASGLSVAENARTVALLNMAISDALVAVMDTKYHYDFWRPVTGIRAGHLDDNPRTESDASWTPLVTTPSFPSYPSAHASASYAARRIAEALFNGRPIPFTLTHPAIPGVTLTYASFRELTDDIDDARVYGGIHFRFDQEAGAMQGKDVGRYIFQHWLRRVSRDNENR
jgi:PAP2 superfamily protein